MKHAGIFRGLLLGMFAAVFWGLPLQALADGMIVPIRPDIRVVGHWAVTYHHVDITVRDQVASVSVDQEFVNTGGGMIEVEYMFPVPPDAAIDSMTLLVNGKEFTAKLMKADEARRIYESIVRRKKDPALLEYVGFGLVKTSAFPLEPNKPAHVVVTYKQPCKKDRDLVEVWYPLNTEKFSAKAIDSVKVKLDIKSKADLTNVYSPTHDLAIKRDKDDPHHLVATYEESKTLPTSDFQVFYKEADEDVGATLLTHQPRGKEDGYYMLLVSPNPKTASKNVIAKDVVLVIDHSGSMREKDKIGQAKEAVAYILKNLNDEDRFNVVSFSDAVDTFFDDLVPAEKGKITDAIDMLDRVDATGGTAIDEALQKAMSICAKNGKKSRPAYVIFMTDGLPTIGKTNEKDILDNARKANDGQARLFALGVGYDVNTHLLDKLVQDNNGKSDYVKPKEKIDTKLSSLYAKIKNPVMTDVKADIKGLKLRDNYPRKISDLFEGDQIVMVGRYDVDSDLSKDDKGAYRTQLVISGNYEGKEKVFEYPVSVRPSGRDWKYDFVEKLWAVRRVGWLLDQIQGNGDKKELIDEVIRLSRDYGIMTPYTSFLADENTPLADARPAMEHRREIWGKGGGAGEQLKKAEGQQGQMNAMAKQAMESADRAAAPTPVLAASQPGSGVMAGGAMYGNKDAKNYEADKKETVGNVRQVANQAVYKRSQTWIASNAANIDLEKDKDKIKTVQKFSDEYFEIVGQNTIEENQILATQQDGETLIIALRGQVYKFE